jgi:septum formation protein
MADVRLILASGSPRRLSLLEQAGIVPDRLMPAEVDETPGRAELPRVLARRLARTKAEVARTRAERDDDLRKALILSADTVVAVGRRVLPKAETHAEAEDCLSLLSGRTHRVFTGICLLTPEGKARERLVESRVRFKRISRPEFDDYIRAGEWQSKAGGYAVQGIAGSFVVRLIGSYTNVVGLPLYETVQLLAGEGYPVRERWTETVA